jgi:hypothetical protein
VSHVFHLVAIALPYSGLPLGLVIKITTKSNLPLKNLLNMVLVPYSASLPTLTTSSRLINFLLALLLR